MHAVFHGKAKAGTRAEIAEAGKAQDFATIISAAEKLKEKQEKQKNKKGSRLSGTPRR